MDLQAVAVSLDDIVVADDPIVSEATDPLLDFPEPDARLSRRRGEGERSGGCNRSRSGAGRGWLR